MRSLFLCVGMLASATIVSVGSGGASTSAYTTDQLAIMVLPKDRLGPEARRLEVAIGSGWTDNAAAADGTLDPNDTGRQLGRAGRIRGYDLSYDDLSAASFVRGRGLLEIDSSVELFKTSAAADAFISKQVRDALRLRGRSVDFGVRLAKSSTFHVGRIGSHTVGLRITERIGGKRIYGTLVGFRVGPLVAAASITRADGKPVAATAERFARALAARIRLASAKGLRARPVPVPATGKKGRPPAGGPQLAPMALSRQDLAKGVRIVRQGYVDDRDVLATFEREFDPSAARFNGSVLLDFECDVSLLRNSTEASGFFFLVRTIYSSPGAAQDFARALAEGAGSNVRAVKIELRRSLSAGDESVVVVVRFSIGAQAFRTALVSVRVKRVIGSLFVTGHASNFHFSDVEPLAGKLAKRIDDRL